MQLRDLSKLTWQQALFIGAVLTLILSSALQYFTPKQAVVQESLRQNFLGGTTEFSGVTYTGDIFTPPTELATGSITAQETENSYFIQRFITQYDLTQDPNIPLIWRNGTLVFTGGTESFQLTLIDAADFSDQHTVADTAIPAAEKIAQVIYQENPPSVVREKIAYYRSGETHPEEAQPSTASILEIPFTFSFEGYPVFVADTIFAPLTVMITEGDQLLKVTLTPQVVSLEKTDMYQTVSIPTALQQIEQNNGTVIATEYGGHGTPSLTNIKQAVFTDASIEYRADTASDTVIPYYHFIGQLTNTENEVFTGHVITPAIQTDFSQR